MHVKLLKLRGQKIKHDFNSYIGNIYQLQLQQDRYQQIKTIDHEKNTCRRLLFGTPDAFRIRQESRIYI